MALYILTSKMEKTNDELTNNSQPNIKKDFVYNLPYNKTEWGLFYDSYKEQGQLQLQKALEKNKNELLKLVDEDTNAFNKIMTAFGLPKSSDEEKTARTQAIQIATKYAIEVPFKVMQLCFDSMEVIKAMAEIGNPNSVTDAGVGALCARSAVMGAFLNVKINATGLTDKSFTEKLIYEGSLLEKKTQALENEILKIVNEKM